MTTKVFSIDDVKLESDVKENKTTVIFGDHSVDVCFDDMKEIYSGFHKAAKDVMKVKKPQCNRRYTSTGDAALVRGEGDSGYHIDIKFGDGIVSFDIDSALYYANEKMAVARRIGNSSTLVTVEHTSGD